MRSQILEDIIFMTAFLAVLVLISMVMARGVNELKFPGELAEIEQARIDVNQVATGEKEFVFGIAAKCNQKIKKNKTYRNLWWGRIITPTAWGNINIIDLSDTGEPARTR